MPDRVPRMRDLVRAGKPYRLVLTGQAVERYPRTGWDRPKASDRFAIVMTLECR